ncbi:MAG: hypothetical protein KJZ80_16470 [Hyphomicrobiaceae bacterium]|nr:hypothetical protein [Hyphomicrobiaceae bacterium]
MLAAIARCTAGYVLACAVSGAIQVAFVLPPLELVGAGPDRLAAAGIWALLATLHSGIFAAPFVLVGLVLAELKGLRSPAYYAAVGFGIAALGFLTQMTGHGFEQPIIVTLYVLTALVSAAVGGSLVYWLVSGRHAGRSARTAASGRKGS